MCVVLWVQIRVQFFFITQVFGIGFKVIRHAALMSLLWTHVLSEDRLLAQRVEVSLAREMCRQCVVIAAKLVFFARREL